MVFSGSFQFHQFHKILDFGDFGDFDEGTNDQDFGDFGNFNDQVTNAKPESVSAPSPVSAVPPVLPTVPSIDISGSIFEDLSTLMSDKVPDNEFTVTIESFKDKEKQLFDCVNASAVDFIWKKSEFESILTIATPNLLQLCESEYIFLLCLLCPLFDIQLYIFYDWVKIVAKP